MQAEFKDNGMTATIEEGNSVTHEMKYDISGNMIEDKNKNIKIRYNVLNLPVSVVWAGTGDSLNWDYAANGAKLRKTVYDNGVVVKTVDYVSGFVYESNQIAFFPTEEGRVKRRYNGTWLYTFDYKDHLGNVRVTYSDSNNDGTAEVLEESAYYAYGLRIEGLSTSNPNNKFTYNGKELEDDHGLNWYHYGARYYDPQLGRWHVVDPLSEYYTPYEFVGNDPINFRDPNGMGTDDDDGSIWSSLGKMLGNLFTSSNEQTQQENEVLQQAAQSDKSAARLQSRQNLVNTVIANGKEIVKQKGSEVASATKEVLAGVSDDMKLVAGGSVVVGAGLRQPYVVAFGVTVYNASGYVDAVSAGVSVIDYALFNGNRETAAKEIGGVIIDIVTQRGLSTAAARYMTASDASFLPAGVKTAGQVGASGISYGVGLMYESLVSGSKP